MKLWRSIRQWNSWLPLCKRIISIILVGIILFSFSDIAKTFNVTGKTIWEIILQVGENNIHAGRDVNIYNFNPTAAPASGDKNEPESPMKPSLIKPKTGGQNKFDRTIVESRIRAQYTLFTNNFNEAAAATNEDKKINNLYERTAGGR